MNTRFRSTEKFVQYHQEDIAELTYMLQQCALKPSKEFLVKLDKEKIRRFCIENSSGNKFNFVKESKIDENGYNDYDDERLD